MILDTATLYFRAFYGLPTSLTNDQGMSINAIRGTVNFIAHLVDQYRPDALGCAWDNDWRPQWRVDLVESYKAHRVSTEPDAVVERVEAVATDDGVDRRVVGAGFAGATNTQVEESPDELSPQVPVIIEVLEALDLPIIGVDGHEADDICASVAAQVAGPVQVVTGDRDLMQLATGENSVVYIGRGIAKNEQCDSEAVRKRFGVPAEHYLDYAVLVGDPSDGLPGVAGIGAKGAAGLVNRFGDLAAIVAAAADPKASGMAAGMAAKVAASVDYIGRAAVVARPVADLELPALPRVLAERRPNQESLERLGTQYRIDKALAKLGEVLDAAR